MKVSTVYFTDRLKDSTFYQVFWGHLVSLHCPTATRAGQLYEPKQSIITWNRLECDIGVPSILATLVLGTWIPRRALIYPLGLYRADDAYLIIFATIPTFSVRHGMSV